MANPPLSRELARQAVDAMSYARAMGKSDRSAARMLGINSGTLVTRVETAKRLYGLEPSTDRPAPELIEVPEVARPRIRVPARRTADEQPMRRVMAVGDLHDSPSIPDKSRLRWLGRHAAETRPDDVVFIGDMADFDSLSSHAKPGSLSDKLRPSYAHDLESLEEALSVFRKEYAHGIVHNTGGNHDWGRPFRYEEASAAAEGMLTGPLRDVFARFDIRLHPEGEYLMLSGAGFVHCPRTLMNREFGGEWMNAIANKSVMSTVFGHSHRGQIVHAHKCGPWGGITLVNLGTALPMGYIKQYAKTSSSSWTWGAYDLTIQSGQIIGHSFHSMDELERRYK